MIHVAEFDGGRIRLEISNEKAFIKAVKKAAREHKKEPGTWKIRLIGSTRTTAPVQKLIDDLTISAELDKTPRRTGETPREILEALTISAELDKTPRPRPGGPLTSN